MSTLDDDMDAALLAAGALTPQETSLLRARLARDPALKAKAGEWEDALAPLGGLAGEIAPPADLLDRIEGRLDRRERLAQLSRTLDANAGEWIVFGPGLRYKELSRDEALRRRTIYLEADAGARIPAHDHLQDEECYMICGDLQIGEESLGPHDYLFAPKGTRHPELYSRAGCRCLIVHAI